MSHRLKSVLLDMAILFLATAVLILPLFRIEYFNDWMSIEGTFIGDARYIRDHWPHPAWHALWYCGNRFDYVYAPGTRYGAAITSMLLRVSPALGYHIFEAILYCLGIAGLYLLVRVISGSRGGAWLAACFGAVLSPEFLILRPYREDSARWMPERLNVLTKWGEGPHICAMAIIPFALAFAFLGLRKGNRMAMAATSVCCALVVLNNLYGALALGVFFPVLVWCVFASGPAPAIWRRTAVIVLLSAGLCAWWLTPSFISLTRRNLVLVAYPGNIWSKLVGISLALAFAGVTWQLGRKRNASAWSIFVAGTLLFFSVEIVGQFWFHFRIVGEPMRFVPEFDIVLILGMVEGLRWLWRRQPWAAVAVAVLCFSFSVNYLTAAWSVFPADPDYTKRVEYRMTEWVAKNLPGSRLFTFGSVSFWYTAWRDLPLANGGSDQGAQTLMAPLARYQIRLGDDPQRSLYWLQALGVDALMVHEQNSQEIYREVTNPRQFARLMPAIYDRDGDLVYRVPRHPGLGRVVEEQRMLKLKPIPWGEDKPELRAYAETIEAIDSPVDYRRPAIDEIRLVASTQPGQAVLVQENYDPGWMAWVDGKPVPIEQDIMEFMRVRTGPGKHEVRFAYGMATDARVGMWISTVALLMTLGLALSAFGAADR